MKYRPKFFKRQATGSAHGASKVVPILIDLIQPRSVVDVGCGVGTWLKAAKDLGVQSIYGCDGEYVPSTTLVIEPNCFIAARLEERLPKLPKSDLLMCLEVAEHLNRRRASTFIDEICEIAPVVAFSAAIPYQGGIGHKNERWQSAWAREFARNGFGCFDAIRPHIWADDTIPYWYRQNIILYIQDECGRIDISKLKQWRRAPEQLDMVHPEFLVKIRTQLSIRKLLSDLLPLNFRRHLSGPSQSAL